MSEVVIELRPSLWTRVSQRLQNWGQKIVAGAKWIGGQIVRAAKWLYHTKAVQWAVAKSKFAGRWVWNIVKGPVGWVAVPVAGVLFAPKTVAVLLFLVLLGVGALAFFTRQLYKELRVAAPEELEEIRATIRGMSDAGTEFNDEPVAGETVADRITYLDVKHREAAEEGDPGTFSELTGRLFLLDVRTSDQKSKLKKDTSVSAIHRACRKRAESNHPTFQWDWARMYQAIRSEDKRYRELIELAEKVKQDTIVLT